MRRLSRRDPGAGTRRLGLRSRCPGHSDCPCGRSCRALAPGQSAALEPPLRAVRAPSGGAADRVQHSAFAPPSPASPWIPEIHCCRRQSAPGRRRWSSLRARFERPREKCTPLPNGRRKARGLQPSKGRSDGDRRREHSLRERVVAPTTLDAAHGPRGDRVKGTAPSG